MIYKPRELIYLALCITFLLVVYSCNSTIERKVLKNSQVNTELLKVINHYEQTKEKEKKYATLFLLMNLNGKGSIEGEIVRYVQDAYEDVCLKYSNGITDFGNLDQIVKSRFDSLNSYFGNSLYKDYSWKKDSENLTATYLIENIDHAFYVWKNMPWAKHVSFENFCEYILPYRIYNESVSDWRSILYEDVIRYTAGILDKTDPLLVCKTVNDSIYPNWKHLDNMPNVFPSVTHLHKYLGGTCQHHHLYMTSVFRSIGIPTCIDETPQNNDWKDRHSWIGIMSKDGDIKKIDIGNPKGEFESNVPLGKGGATKIYRNTFTNNKRLVNQEVEIKKIPAFFRNINLKDVTKEYSFPQRDLAIDIYKESDHQFVYLCAPDLGLDVRPVAVSKINRHNKVSFNNVGYPALYFCAGFSNGVIEHQAFPVFVDKEGERKEIIPNFEERIDLKLHRKYKPSDSVLVYTNEVIGARIQGSNSENFIDTEDLYHFSNAMDYYYAVNTSVKSPKRFIRFLPNTDHRINLAEIEFWGYYENDSSFMKIEGQPISNITLQDHLDIKNIENAFDSDIRTNCICNSGSWIGLDLQNKKAIITKVRYLVRNHFNIVEVNDFYELKWFDGHDWISEGIKQAKDNFLIYDNVPSNTVYLLKNHSRGNQERMFLYENGQQTYP